MKTTKPFYNRFHGNSKMQSSIISEDDFTYRGILEISKPHLKKAQRVLDIGCGVGSVDLYFGKAGKKVLGIDVSRIAIRRAKESASYLGLNDKVKFQVLEFPQDVPKGKFDVAICSEVLEHLKDDDYAVKLIGKLLKTKGILIASSPSLNAPLYKLGFLKKFDKRVGHLRRYSEISFRRLFENADLEILKIKKTEGILRNFLFTSTIGGFLLKVLKRPPFSVIVTFVDNIAVLIFGESNFFVVARRK